MRLATTILLAFLWIGSVNPQAQNSVEEPAPSASPAPTPVPATPPPPLTLQPGSPILLQLETSMHTRSTRQGDRVSFKTSEDVREGNLVAVPAGCIVRATVTKVQRPGRLKGRAEIRLRFEELTLSDGQVLPIRARVTRAGFTKVNTTKEGDPQLKGEGGRGGGAVAVALGGLQGAAMGGIFGGARGAAVGSAAGAAAGLAGVLLQRGPDLDLPRDMMFEVHLDQPLNVPAASAQKATEQASVRRQHSPSSTGDSPQTDNPPEDGDSLAKVPDFSRDKEAENPPKDIASINQPPHPPTELPPPSSVPTDSEAGESGGFKIQVAVQLVNVDTVVRDRTGRPMDKLQKEDFRLSEDGVEQQIRNFSRDELPLAVALVIDRSGSVMPYMNEIRQAAYQALSQLKRGDKVALFAFAGEVQRLEELTTDRQRIADRISQIRAGGGTNIIDGLFDAVYYLSSVAPNSRRAVILISDNHATTRPRSSQNQLIRLALESETVVYSIKTEGESVPVTMRVPIWLGGTGSVSKVTQETGGEIIDARGSGSLDAALATAISRLKLRYTLSYQSSNNASNGAFRKIDVRLADSFGRLDNDYTVHARRGYYAPVEKVAQK